MRGLLLERRSTIRVHTVYDGLGLDLAGMPEFWHKIHIDQYENLKDLVYHTSFQSVKIDSAKIKIVKTFLLNIA